MACLQFIQGQPGETVPRFEFMLERNLLHMKMGPDGMTTSWGNHTGRFKKDPSVPFQGAMCLIWHVCGAAGEIGLQKEVAIAIMKKVLPLWFDPASLEQSAGEYKACMQISETIGQNNIMHMLRCQRTLMAQFMNLSQMPSGGQDAGMSNMANVSASSVLLEGFMNFTRTTLPFIQITELPAALDGLSNSVGSAAVNSQGPSRTHD